MFLAWMFIFPDKTLKSVGRTQHCDFPMETAWVLGQSLYHLLLHDSSSVPDFQHSRNPLRLTARGSMAGTQLLINPNWYPKRPGGSSKKGQPYHHSGHIFMISRASRKESARSLSSQQLWEVSYQLQEALWWWENSLRMAAPGHRAAGT